MFDHALRFVFPKNCLFSMSQSYRVHGRFWIESDEGTFLGYGRVLLLERIREHGSITAAAKSMNMSYRHAWKLVDSMNRQGSQPVVERKTGGKGGGGAVITEDGEKAIACFHRASQEIRKYLKDFSDELTF